MLIKRIEFDEYGEIAAIDFEDALAHDVMTFLAEYKIRAGAQSSLQQAVEQHHERKSKNAQELKALHEAMSDAP